MHDQRPQIRYGTSIELDSGARVRDDVIVAGKHDEVAAAPDAELAGTVVECARRSLAATGVKVEWRDEWVFDLPEGGQGWRRRRGGLVPLLGRVAWRVAKVVWKSVVGDKVFGQLGAKGILEPATGRYMIDFGSFAQIHDGQRSFGGRSGRRLSTLAPFPDAGRSAEMLWLLRLLLGTTHAKMEGEDVLHRTPCQRLAVRCDLGKAAAASPIELRVPQSDSFDQLRALPATVWIDEENIRRVELRGIEHRNLCLELWDYGIATDQFNWSRLPTFRSPSEAADYSGQHVAWHRKLRRKAHADA